jgi:hypothetical protein
MNIVGTESVSMQDLMKLGPQALNSMAQGQINSIAPSYMIIAALKALTDHQKGANAPVPQNTVKEQVIAQATPPAQAGIGAMLPQQPPPVKQFQVGGPVGTDLINKQIADYFRRRFGGADAYTGANGIGKLNRDIIDFLTGGKEKYSASEAATKATTPTDFSNVTAGNSTTPFSDVVAGNSTFSKPEVVPKISVGGKNTIEGKNIGIQNSGAVDPLAKYKEYNPTVLPLDKIAGLNAPANVALDQEIANLPTQKAAKLAELGKERDAAGLAAFGANMLKGRGFGGAFAPAAAASIAAMQDKAKEARALEIRYEDLARDLGLKKGTEAYQRFMDDMNFKAAERKFAADIEDKKFDAGFKTTQASNREALELRNQALESRKLDIMSREVDAKLAAVREAAAARGDEKLFRQVEIISKNRTAAVEKARQGVMNRYEKDPMFQHDPNMKRMAFIEANNAGQRADDMYLIQLRPFLKQIGVPTE